MAHQSNMIFMLARTNANAAKRQEGISFFLVELSSPGVTVRPIRTLSDELEFCEVFFDDVRVPLNNLVGEVNQGWTLAKALLGHERLFVGSPRYVRGALERLQSFAQDQGLFDDEAFVDRFLRLKLDYDDFVVLYGDFANFVKNGGTLGPEASLLKLLSSEMYQKITEEMLEMTGENGVLQPAGSNEQAEAALRFFHARPSTIAGGSSQVQRGIIAKAVLGLPS
jgi:alkylation response protein AidB-like acyl-CoA dehydrogenase